MPDMYLKPDSDDDLDDYRYMECDDYDDYGDCEVYYEDFDWCEYIPPALHVRMRWALVMWAQRLKRRSVYIGKHDPCDDIPF